MALLKQRGQINRMKYSGNIFVHIYVSEPYSKWNKKRLKKRLGGLRLS